MFTTDFAEDFSGLTARQILALEKKAILVPERQYGQKYYSYNDIYILRMIKLLKRDGIHLKKIEMAYEYLRTLKPEDPLSSFTILHDRKEVYEASTELTVIASKWGQLTIPGVLTLYSVGSELETTRLSMNHYVNALLKSKKDYETGKVKGEMVNIQALKKMLVS